MIEALIFDFDGVIIDTETPEYTTLQELFQSHGVELQKSLWTQFIGSGVGDFDVYEHLSELAGRRLDKNALRNGRRQLYLAQVEANPILPGVQEAIAEAKRLGLKLGMASSSSSDWVEGHLARRGLLGYFDCVRSRNDVKNVKPDPELYVSCLKGLGVDSSNAIVIEDSANGVTAAKSTGLFCVLVPNEMTKDLPITNADLRLNSLADMPLSQIIALAEEAPSQKKIHSARQS